MASTFSSSRPLHGSQPQTEQYEAMQRYAYSADVQDLLQKMLGDVFSSQPEDPLDFMTKWMQAEKKRRADKAKLQQEQPAS